MRFMKLDGTDEVQRCIHDGRYIVQEVILPMKLNDVSVMMDAIM